MRKRSRWKVLSLVGPAAVIALLAGMAPSTVVSARPATASPAGIARSVRIIARSKGLTSLSDGVGHLQPGTEGPEFPSGSASGDRAPSQGRTARVVNRSQSPRPDADQALATAARGPLQVPVAASTPVSGTKPGLHNSFEGINLYQERYVANHGNQFSFEPPDQGMCVGNGYVLETVNDALRVFTTNGTPKSPPIDLNSFYGYPAVINRTTGVYGPEITDPSCLYDSVNHRFIHIALTLDADRATGGLTLNNHIDIAVSKTASPLGGWNFYKFNATDDGRLGTPHHSGCPCIGDYPHIAADRYGVYITTNEYPWDASPGVFGNNFNGAQLYALSRKALTSGAAHLRVVQLSNLALTIGGHRSGAFTLIGANSPEGVFSAANGGSEYFLSSTATAEAGSTTGRSNLLGLWTLSNTRSLDGDHLALTLGHRNVTSEVYGVPPLSEQKLGNVPQRDCLVVGCDPAVGGPSPGEVEGPLDSSDSRIFNTWYADGRVWGSLSTIVQVAGNIQTGAAWFSLSPQGAVLKQGYLATAHNNVIYPGIATLANGRGAMALNIVGRNWYPTAGYSLVDRAGAHGLHVAAAGRSPQDGFCEYVFDNCAGTDPPAARPRWGDYPAAQAVGDSVWVANEYIGQSCTFSQFKRDLTCGKRRGPVANWSTRLTRITP